MVAFFVVNIWLVGMCVPYDDKDLISGSGTMGSPFVIAIERANVMWLAHVINGFIFITVISCGITSAYIASRSLTALADMSVIHPIFGRKDSQGRPYVALMTSIILGGGLCYLNCGDKGSVVYGWFSDLVCTTCWKEWRFKLMITRHLGRNLDVVPVDRHIHLPYPVSKGPKSARHLLSHPPFP